MAGYVVRALQVRIILYFYGSDDTLFARANVIMHE